MSSLWIYIHVRAILQDAKLLHAFCVADSITAISCGFGFVVQQVVRLVVGLADCCMQLAVDLFWTWCATSCPTVVRYDTIRYDILFALKN